jgi:hypothetical protein
LRSLAGPRRPPSAWAAARVAPLAPDGTPGALLECAAGGIAFGAVGLPLAFWLGDAPTRDALRRVVRRLRRRR